MFLSQSSHIALTVNKPPPNGRDNINKEYNNGSQKTTSANFVFCALTSECRVQMRFSI